MGQVNTNKGKPARRGLNMSHNDRVHTDGGKPGGG